MKRVVCAVVAGGLAMFASIGAANAQGQGESTPPSASASDSGSNLEQARVHYERAIELYNEESFDAALVEIRRAYDLAPSYKMLFNIGHIQRARKDYVSALSAFERYLAQGKASITAARRAEVEKEISVLRTRVASLEIECPVSGATISIDDVNVGTTPLKGPLTVNPGRRKVVASKQGYTPAVSWVELAGTDAERLELVPTAVATSTPAAGAPAQEASKTPMTVAWIVTGGLAVATGIFGGIALSKSNDLSEETNRFRPTNPDAVERDLESSKSSMQAFSITTDVLAGATLVSAGVALYLTLTQPSSSEERAQSRPKPVGVGVGLGRLSLSGTF